MKSIEEQLSFELTESINRKAHKDEINNNWYNYRRYVNTLDVLNYKFNKDLFDLSCEKYYNWLNVNREKR